MKRQPPAKNRRPNRFRLPELPSALFLMPLFDRPSRLFRGGFLLLVCALTALPLSSIAQFKFREPPNRQQPSALDDAAGQELWQWFLAGRAIGQFRIEGALTYRPAGAASVSRDLVLEGDWTRAAERTRITLGDADNARTWRVERTQAEAPCITAPDGTTTTLGGDDWNRAFSDDLPFSWTDLLMPYLRWNEVAYEGPDRHLGRPAHRFRLYRPDGDNFPAAVVVTLDHDFAALLKVDLLDHSGFTARRVRVGGFKKFGDDWMFSELHWEDRAARSSVTLRVYSFFITE
jgi:hypothetical protein